MLFKDWYFMASLWCRTLGSKLVCMSWQIGMGAEFVFLVVPPKFVLFVKGFLSDTNWRIRDCALSKFDQKIVFELVLAPIQIRLFRAETKIKSILHSIKKRAQPILPIESTSMLNSWTHYHCDQIWRNFDILAIF